MNSLIDSLRNFIGTPDFYIENGNYSGTWDYGAMCEWMLSGIIILVCVASVFKFLLNLVK